MKNKNKPVSRTPRYYLLLLWVLIHISFYSCTNTGQNHEALNQKNNSKDTIQGKSSSSFTDTVIIGFPSAVFYRPDQLQSEKFKDIHGEMQSESMQHDCFYQIKNASSVLKKYYPNIIITEVKNARYLYFKQADGEFITLDLNKYDPCGMFIFDGQKSPLLVDMTNVDTQLGFYFSK